MIIVSLFHLLRRTARSNKKRPGQEPTGVPDEDLTPTALEVGAADDDNGGESLVAGAAEEGNGAVSI